MVLALMVIGVVVLATSIWAWRKNRKVVVANMPPLWRAFWRWRWVIGVALGVGSYFLRYPLDGTTDRYMVHGVPFMSYAFDQRGHDYVGLLTMPALLLNFVTWAMLPQLVFWAFTLHRPSSGD
jgi:hypothetical protein